LILLERGLFWASFHFLVKRDIMLVFLNELFVLLIVFMFLWIIACTVDVLLPNMKAISCIESQRPETYAELCA